MNLHDQEKRFYVHEDGSCHWQYPELAALQNKDGGWTDMTDFSEAEFVAAYDEKVKAGRTRAKA